MGTEPCGALQSTFSECLRIVAVMSQVYIVCTCVPHYSASHTYRSGQPRRSMGWTQLLIPRRVMSRLPGRSLEAVEHDESG